MHNHNDEKSGNIIKNSDVGVKEIRFYGKAGKNMELRLDLTVLLPANTDNLALLQKLIEKIQSIKLTE